MEQSKLKGVQDALHAVEQQMRARHFGVALDLAYQAANKFPDVRSVDVKLGEVLKTCKEFEKALGVYRRVHERTQEAGGSSEIGLLVGIARCHVRLAQFSGPPRHQMPPLVHYSKKGAHPFTRDFRHFFVSHGRNF